MFCKKNSLFILFLDVNECTEVTSKCHQVCNNMLGSYSCDCREGYILQSDQASCESGKQGHIYMYYNCELSPFDHNTQQYCLPLPKNMKFEACNTVKYV